VLPCAFLLVTFPLIMVRAAAKVALAIAVPLALWTAAVAGAPSVDVRCGRPSARAYLWAT